MRAFATGYATLALVALVAGISLESLNAWRPGGTVFTLNTLAACWTDWPTGADVVIATYRPAVTLEAGYTGRPTWALPAA